jgi:prepilin-type N-terminal cleavage/methylation domain-containing protein
MKKNTGFTLIELLVTIAIIAILTAIITANFSTARSRSRDAKRISDIANIQLALSLYFDRCNQYPTNLTGALTTKTEGCPSGISLDSFITKIPTPPQPGQTTVYAYGTNVDPFAGVPVPTDYILGAQLENSSDVLIDSVNNPTPPNTVYSVVCNTSTKNYCIGPK